jgi:deoxyribodipyrimidine photo-lyase
LTSILGGFSRNQILFMGHTSRPSVIYWFRRDLRLADNPALVDAIAAGGPIIPVFILDDDDAGSFGVGAAARWWLHHSLTALDAALRDKRSRLILRRGSAPSVMAELIDQTGATRVVASRRVEPWARAQEKSVAMIAARHGAGVQWCSYSLLHDPAAMRTLSGGPYKVFTPFWKSLQRGMASVSRPLPAPESVPGPDRWPVSDPLDAWGLRPSQPDWAAGFDACWVPGEAGAQARLQTFLSQALTSYGDRRDFPAYPATSGLSAALHFGEISPLTVWHQGQRWSGSPGLEKFLSELAWREFCAHLLFHFPDLPQHPLRAEFSDFPWESDAGLLQTWQKGQTGYPIVDAGMRQLWQTGWMHNRVRMIVASFLVKDLLLPWQDGQAWFWNTLVDADLANNAAGWQWVSGCGADAAPYFRVFNPVRQGVQFDPQGAYVRRWCPELADLPDDCIHAPWEAPPLVLLQAGIRLGETYPVPVVDHAAARNRALRIYHGLTGKPG